MKAIYIVCMIALISAMMVMPAAATTWTVCSAGCDFTGIDAATEKNGALADGDTVFVYNGSYTDTGSVVAIWQRITLKGEGADAVTYNMGGFHFEIHGAGTVIEGFKIVNTDRGMEVKPEAQDCIIRNCVFEGLTNMYGMSLSANNITLRDSVFTGATGAYGTVHLCDDSCTVVNNTIIGNTGAGILIYPSTTAASSIITGNNISSNGYGIFLYEAGSGNKIFLNNFVDNGVTATTFGTTPPAVTYWNSTEPIEYTYDGSTYTNYMGNNWGSDYTGVDVSPEDGIGDTNYVIPDGLGNDFRPLMQPFEDYLGGAPPAPADLTPTAITPNCGGYLFDGNNNEICALIDNLGGAASAFSVRFDINGVTQDVAVTGLAAGENTTVCVTDSTIRTAGDTVAITVTADCNDEVTEDNETNNVLSSSETVVYNGYKGKRYTGGEDITTKNTFDLNGDLVYSAGDSHYLSSYSYPHWTTYDASWTDAELVIPTTATVVDARLYVPYTWDKASVMSGVSLTFNAAAQTPDAHYSDEKMYGTSYPYGMLVYDVTGDFDTTGNTANLTNSHNGGGNVSMRGMMLVVVYEDANEPRRQIFVNEEFDLLYGGSNYCTTPAEATAWAPITGAAINPALTANARLITFAPGADGSAGEGELIFNGQTWNDEWTDNGVHQIGISDRDVTAYLLSTGNEVGIQSNADWMEASNAILVVEAVPSVKTATCSGTATFESNAGTIVDLTAVAESAMPDGGPDLMYPHGFFSFNITGLANGATVDVTVTLPADVPEGTQYWKYNGSDWVQIPVGSNDGDNVITITLIDGGLGDSDGLADGTIVDPGAPGVTNLIYLDSDNSVSQGSPVQVDVYTYISATDKAVASQFDIEYDPNCIQDFPSFDPTGSDWLAAGTGADVSCTNPLSGTLRFVTTVGKNPAISGHAKVGTLTFTCNTTCCGSSLDFTDAKYTDGSIPFVTLYPAVDNGTFLCGDVIDITKKVWDGSAWVDAIEPLGPEWTGQDVRFNITVTSGCLDLSDVEVNDIMSDSLEYNNNADPAEDSNTTHTADWTLGSIAAGTSKSIEFNATIVNFGPGSNTATATATVTSLGFDVTDTASLIVEVGEPEMSARPDSDDCYNVGEQFDVLVNITPMGKSIMGAQFDLHFNASVLQAETVTYGDFLAPDGASVFVSHSDIDNLNGVVSFAAARQGTLIGVTAPGTFAIVHFTAMMQGANSKLNLTDALAATNGTVETIYLVTVNDTAEVCSNPAPVAVAKSDFTYNNIAEKGLSKAYFNGTESFDPNGTITYWRWWVDDGSSIVGESAVHLFEVPMYWNSSTGEYEPANVTLTVTDDGMPLTDGSDSIDVIVWIAGDATGDGRVNIADAVTFGMQFGADCHIDANGLRWFDNEYGDMADLNNDKRVNIGDAMLLGTCWGHTAW